jgi:DsbE subfamily thiol:disulfide oxidoreductase
MEPVASAVRARRLRRLARAFALALVLTGILLVVLAIQEFSTRRTRGVSGITIANFQAVGEAVDRPAPGFELPALDGTGTISLRDFRGKVVVLNFWASWCGPCREEAPHLQRIWQENRSRGVQLLGVNHRDDRAAARVYEDEFGITFPSVFDPAGRLSFEYRLVGLPTTFVIGRDGRIDFQFTGKVDEAILSRALADALEEGWS